MRRIALSKLIEADRRTCASTAIKAATSASAALVRQAVAASGKQPEFAVTLVHQLARQRLVPLIRDTMLAADLMGRRRVMLRVAPVLAKREKIHLAGTVFDETLSLMQKRLALSDAELKKLSDKYADAAFRISDKMTKGLERKLYDQIIESVRNGDLQKDAVASLRGVFEKEGLAPWSNYKLEAVFRTQAQIGYAAGRYSAQQDPAVQDVLWGYEYSAIEDDRTTELCQELDGTKLPKDDPFWGRYTPPNHYNCRSTVLEVFKYEEPEAAAAPDEIEEPADGFRVNFGEALVQL